MSRRLSSRPLAWTAALSLAWAAGGCASPALRAARSGDVANLRASIAGARAKGALTNADLEPLARAVAEREVRTSGTHEALARIDEVRGCALQIREALAVRARGTDEVAASATLALLDAGREGAQALDRTRLAALGAVPAEPFWRATAARASGGGAGPTTRAGYLSDGDERVRLAALRSALEAPRREDAPALLEAARLDPSPLARALAVRALGALGGADIVLALRDLYAREDEPGRVAIIDAWATPANEREGGQRELLLVAESERGLAGLEASARLLAASGDRAALGLGVLIRAVDQGTPGERVFALAHLPASVFDATSGASSGARVALERAAEGKGEVRTAALSRLLELPVSRERARAALRDLARGGSRRAAALLASTGDEVGLAQLERDAASTEAEVRLSAGRALVDAGRAVQVAELLGDPDAHVRTTLACEMLVRDRR